MLTKQSPPSKLQKAFSRYQNLPRRSRLGLAGGGVASLLVFFLWMSSSSSLRQAPGPALRPEEAEGLTVSTGTFAGGATLYDLLIRSRLPPPEAFDVIHRLGDVFDPRGLRPADAYEIGLDRNGGFRRLTLTRGLKTYTVDRSGAALRAYGEDVPVATVKKSVAGRLHASLWESMSRQGLPPALIMSFADIFAWNVDFLTEPRVGDQFALVWEEKKGPDGRVAGRRIVSAVYEGENTGKRTAVSFNGDYYTAAGESLRRAFLRAPLNFRRISSGFSLRRFHPILRTYRPHMGIDYAAPQGTPVVSVGNGVVVFKGWKTMYGNFVQVRHNAAYITCYAHFSRYAQGLRVGSRVSQGQVLGYVGSTGHATGPHLDFRVIKNGQFVNFLKLAMPADKAVPVEEKTLFEQEQRKQMESLEGVLKKEVQS